MTIILDYENFDSKYLDSILKFNNVSYKYSLLEKDIIGAEKLILPDPINLKRANRKITLMNLTSVLRMVRCPILGINGGFKMMCKGFSHGSKNGLCLFEMELDDEDNISNHESIFEGNLQILKSTILLDKSYDNHKILFDKSIQPKPNDYSTVGIKHEVEEFSILHEKGDYFGLVINLDNNQEVYKNIMTNFTK